MRKTIFRGRNSKIPETLSMRDMILFCFAFLAPLGPAFIYGQAVHSSKGSLALGYLIAGVVIVLIVISYRKIISAAPGKVSTLTGVSQTFHPLAGFAASWSFLLAYIVLPVLAFVFGAKMLEAVIPSIPIYVEVVLFGVVAIGVNLLGTKTVARANLILVSLGMAFILVYILVCLMAVSKGLGVGKIVSTVPFKGTGAGFTSYITGIAFAAASMFGIEAMTTISSETEGSKDNMKRALLIAGIAIASLFFLITYASGLAWPVLDNLMETNTIMEIGTRAGGAPMKTIFCLGTILSVTAVGISGQAAAAKSLETMGLEGLIPRGIFTGTPWRTGSPMLNHIIIFVITMILACTVKSLVILSDLVRFGGIVGFVLINVAVIYHFFYKNKDSDIVTSLVIPGVATISCLSFFVGIKPVALFVGLGWLIAGAAIRSSDILLLVKQPKKGNISAFLGKDNSDLDSVMFDDSELDISKFDDSELDISKFDDSELDISKFDDVADKVVDDVIDAVVEPEFSRPAVENEYDEPVALKSFHPAVEDEYDEPVALNNEHLIDKLQQIVSEEEDFVRHSASVKEDSRARESDSMVWAPVEAPERKGGEIVWENPEADSKPAAKDDDVVMRWGSDESDRDAEFPDEGPGYWRKL
jgi:putrescine importer